MKWTQTLIPTLKEEPAEAEVDSHKLMIRSGMIRKLSSGVYSYLPIGFRVLNKIIKIVREEMEKAGAVEVYLPALVPVNLLEKSGRIDVFGSDLIQFKDRYGKEVALGPTHEEVITDLVKNTINSYRQLPITLFQIQTKFRDEIRPRFGVLRSKEFLMKDAYSFDTTLEKLNTSYKKMYNAYCRIFDRCGSDYVVVEADSGAMGGDVSHEFMAPCNSGEDLLVICPNGDYKSNIEKAYSYVADPSSPDSRKQESFKETVEINTPNVTTIDDVSNFLQIKPDKMVKTLIYNLQATPVQDKTVVVLVRGDHEVNEAKLKKIVDTKELILADNTTIEKVTGGPVGFSGPVGLKNTTIIADHSILNMENFVTGANKKDYHLKNVNVDRDFKIDRIADIRHVVEGDKCPKCSSNLNIKRGIELGHVFKLGTKYTETFNALFLDSNGKETPIVMGCYGIGINRIIAATIENSHDKDGIIWPLSIAPYQVLITIVNPADTEIFNGALKIYDELIAAGIEVLLDDRNARPGVKFKDADLIGIPIRITVGKHFKESQEVEIKVRKDDNKYTVPINNSLPEIKKLIEQLSKAKPKQK
ncbi:MAG: proline--tRNA ligase [Candidatus Anammoxibacter sp.]